ncbi:polyhydroxybutyrate depolymerase [Pseudaestuariivita atlantica]|uniref:Polyhydroxybutyrate depolymerase n=1 Tax=Pseudaestuariivita atlantica TaxID=1317121 RepID=A0A0L1JRW0_9RHOB|nr:polyhydroxybutyrate depolymerase [Pseudaestuariivita atlantica]
MFLLCLPSLAIAERCTGQTPCEIPEGSYHVREPDGWDGTSPLPVLLHFHGWQRQGTLIVNHARIAGHTRRRGVLLVAPNGPGRSWDWWNRDTANIALGRAVLEDVKARYPVDTDRIYVSGYSWGGSMAWRFVCADGADVAALLSISGTIDQDEDCATAPREVRHVHGLSDTVMPYPTGPGGDEMEPVALWRRAFGCGAAMREGTWQAVPWLRLERFAWEDCATGRVTLDQHGGGHFIPHGWIGWQLDQLMGREPRYP